MVSVIESLDSCGWSEFVREPVIIKKKNPEAIVYPIFDRCLKYIDSDDHTWIKLFRQASKGKLPRKFVYEVETNSLHYNRFKHKDKVTLSSDELEATKQITDFFKKNARIFSQKDYQNNTTDGDNSNLSWTGLSESIKSYLISDYVRELCQKYNLTDPQDYINIKIKIDQGLLSGKITNSKIKINRYKITKITNLKWNPKDHYFYLEGTNSRATSNQKMFRENWILPDDQFESLITSYIPTQAIFNRCAKSYLQ